MSKTQYYKRNINNNINNYKDYNNNNYYNSNNYHNYNYKKNYYNEERKKNNYYNNKNNNDIYNNEYKEYNDYEDAYNEYEPYDQYNQYDEYNNGYNNYTYSGSNKKKRNYNRYNNNINNNNINNNNFYENNEEVKNKTENEVKHKKEILKLKINIKEDKYKELIIYKEDDINQIVQEFCNDNFINEKLIEPLCNKIKQSLSKIEQVTNNARLSRDSVLMLEKAKKYIQNK